MDGRPALRERRALLAGAAALTLATRGIARAAPASAEARTVILLRHAEKASDDARDPSLSAAGTVRATELARVLGALAVTHLFASAYKRTQLTLQPLATARKLTVATYDSRDLAKLAGELRGLPAGSVAVVAGHSNTTPELATLLGGQLTGLDEKGQLPDDDYDRLVVQTLVACAPPENGSEPRAVATLELRYGA